MKAVAVVARRLAKVLGAVAAEIGEGGEIHEFRYLRERQPFIIQIVFQNGSGVAVNVVGYAVPGYALRSGREIFRRNVQSRSIVAYIALRSADTGSEQGHELFNNVSRPVGMLLCSVALSVRLKDVVHHGKAEAPHQFTMEL